MQAKSILLIDDNEVDNYITRQLLLKNKIGDEIIVKSSAAAGLKYLEEIGTEPGKIPDYIFLDISMPVMNGFGFLNEYAKFPDIIKDHCIIFMLSSSNSQQDIDLAKQYTCVKKFLQKPLNINILKEI